MSEGWNVGELVLGGAVTIGSSQRRTVVAKQEEPMPALPYLRSPAGAPSAKSNREPEDKGATGMQSMDLRRKRTE